MSGPGAPAFKTGPDALWTELPEYYSMTGISGYRQKIYGYIYMRYLDVP